ncbi:MAG: endonuclease III domain-containing protein [Gammaproteobacteria bacterium]|nr:MAG: endonuclease III domain-containing protein [Gammaproteobacteria bacterium]
MMVYRRLLSSYGKQYWWPGDSPFEVMVGAVLTQNTAWSNVERAILALKKAGVLDAQSIVNMTSKRLAGLIRPSGYFNIKAKRLKHFCLWYLENGGHASLKRWKTRHLRRSVLAVHGVGPETADDMLLYAFNRPVFVIDAYTRRIFVRLGLIVADQGYETMRAMFEAMLGPDTALYNEYHALLVKHGKDVCRSAPRCAHCCLVTHCTAGQYNTK